MLKKKIFSYILIFFVSAIILFGLTWVALNLAFGINETIEPNNRPVVCMGGFAEAYLKLIMSPGNMVKGLPFNAGYFSIIFFAILSTAVFILIDLRRRNGDPPGRLRK